uniref:Uncharacterized protein n=1 Tax=Micrurus surinamensis TaxID=129470 RepID=A0A2D4NMX8_MICSU
MICCMSRRTVFSPAGHFWLNLNQASAVYTYLGSFFSFQRRRQGYLSKPPPWLLLILRSHISESFMTADNENLPCTQLTQLPCDGHKKKKRGNYFVRRAPLELSCSPRVTAVAQSKTGKGRNVREQAYY